jgi:hypothetical protein
MIVQAPVSICYQCLIESGNELKWRVVFVDNQRLIRWVVGKPWLVASFLTAERCQLTANLSPMQTNPDSTVVEFTAKSTSLLDFENFHDGVIETMQQVFKARVGLFEWLNTPEGIREYQTLMQTNLRRWLGLFDSVQIETLCLDYFPKVYERFGRGMRCDEMVNLLLDHCRRYPAEQTRLLAILSKSGIPMPAP